MAKYEVQENGNENLQNNRQIVKFRVQTGIIVMGFTDDSRQKFYSQSHFYSKKQVYMWNSCSIIYLQPIFKKS